MEPPGKKVQELPEDIWNQILLRIPAEPLIRLKSVCKSWSDLINSHNFQISHHDYWRIRVSAESKSRLVTLRPNRPALLSFEQVSDAIDIPSKLHCRPLEFYGFCNWPFGPTEIAVLHSDDGLVLFRGKYYQLFIYNPLITNSYFHLPSPGFRVGTNRDWTWTFVYDPSNRHYVIFHVDCYEDCSVFALRIDLNGGGSGRKTGFWRQVWSPEQHTITNSLSKTGLIFRASISVNGKTHFLIYYKGTGILTINAATEESTVTKCSGSVPVGLSVFFKSSREFYQMKESSSREAFELWVIDDFDNPIWSKRHVIIKPTNLSNLCFPITEILKEGDRLIMFFWLVGRPLKSMFIYDISVEKWQEFDIEKWREFGIVKSPLLQKLMLIKYSLLSLTDASGTD